MDGERILVEIEQSLGITLDEAGVSRVVTIGDLGDIVYAAVPAAKPSRCLAALAFWRLRRALVDVFGVDRAAVKPDAPLAGSHLEVPRPRRRGTVARSVS